MEPTLCRAADGFTPATITTMTFSGKLSNLEFKEEKITKLLLCYGNCVIIESNYGKVIHPDYVEPVIVRKSNRGRKKKLKIVKPRKTQGTGTCFNSQITFHVKCYEEVGKIYKFKVFCNGVTQVPGVKPQNINGFYAAFSDVAYCFNMFYKSDKSDKLNNPLIEYYDTTIVLQNFKYAKQLNAGEMVDLEKLYLHLKKYQWKPDLTKIELIPENTSNNELQLFMLRYNRDDTKLAFTANAGKKVGKTIRVNIFMSGKINILGGSTNDNCEKIYLWFANIYNTGEYTCSPPAI